MKPFKKKSVRRNPEESLRKWSFARIKEQSWSPRKDISWKRIFFLGVLFCISFGILLFSILLLVILKDLPPIDEEKLIFSESTVIFDSTGKTQLYSVHGDQNRKIVPIEEMSHNIVSAIMAAEDDQFFAHTGFDIGGITMAFCHEILGNMGGLCPPRGGSTLTQQLVKNFFLSSERTLTRKLRELVLSYKIEKKYPKSKILEIYLNGISFGSNLSGVETASQAFFKTSVRNLSPAQAAVLAAIPKAPTKYSPFGENVYSRILLSKEVVQKNGFTSFDQVDSYGDNTWRQGLIGKEIELADGATDYFPGRSDWVLWRMNDLGFLSDEKFKASKKELRQMRFDEFRQTIIAPHFVMWVRNQLEEQFDSELVERGGLKVYTTLDLSLQKKAEEAISKNIQRNTEEFQAKNAALVSVDPQSGYVRALVGSVDYWNEEIDGKVNVILKKRLPGSSFKPIAFAAAFLTGKLSPASVLFDVKTDFGDGWVPQNYNGKFQGPVSLRIALGHSLNIPAVKATIIAGVQNVYDLATRMGVHFDFDSDFYGAAIALGGAEARPLDMALAFSTFANGGKKIEPITILRVEDRYGNLLYSAEQENQPPEEVLDSGVAYLIADMLSDTAARGPGWNSRLQLSGRENIAKTGTADKKKNDVPWPADCWTIGGTPQLMTAVWTGNTTGEVLGRRASGFEIAAPIWHQFMSDALEDEPVENFDVPSTVSRLQVSKLSGLLPIPGTKQNLITSEIFANLNIPNTNDSSLSFVEIDTVSGKLPTEMTPKAAREEKAVLNMHAFYPDWPKWEDPVQEWIQEHKEEFLQKFDIGNDILSEVPTERDDVHTKKTKKMSPTVSFVSPAPGGTVAAPKSTIVLDVTAKNGLEKIVFQWNGRIIKSFNTMDTSFVIPIPRSATDTNTITVQVVDSLLYTIEKSIEVNIGKDTDKPEVSILRPKKHESIPGGSTIMFSAEASDKIGAIQKVEFYIDGKKVGADLFTPYQQKWESPNVSQEHSLRVVAYDRAGNTATKSVPFEVQKRALSKTFGISSPEEGASFPCSTSEVIVASINEDMRGDFESLEIWAENPSRGKMKISEFFKLSTTGFFETNFSPQVCGQWKFYVKAILAGDSRRTSSKVSVEFQD